LIIFYVTCTNNNPWGLSKKKFCRLWKI